VSERRKKLLVLVVGIAVFGPLTAWRTLEALREARQDEFGMVEYQCDGLVRFVPAPGSPEGVRGTNIHRYAVLPDLPARKLGTLRLQGPLPWLRSFAEGRPEEWGCLRRAKERLGANAWVLESVAQVPGLPEGYGELVESIYLLHAGELGSEYRARLGPTACLVSRVFPDTDAARAGLRTGDVLLALDQAPVSPGNPCAVLQDIDDREGGSPVSLSVLRGQELLELEGVAPDEHERFGCEVRGLPIL
jgi:hypothetical protein